MSKTLNQLKQKILGQNKSHDDALIFWCDMFMQRYGMSLNEFRELEIPVFFNLRDVIIKEQKEMNKEGSMPKQNSRGRL